MQKAEDIEQSDAAGAIHCFTRLRKLWQQIIPIPGGKRRQMHGSDFKENPETMKKCKALRAVPTDESLASHT